MSDSRFVNMLPDQPPLKSIPPMPTMTKAAVQSRRHLRAIWIVGFVSFAFLFYYVTRPVVLRAHRNTPLTTATTNAREIHQALMKFDAKHGSFPNGSTIAHVKGSSATSFSFGTKTSNDYFRQLLAEGLGNERMFYPGYGPKPDNNWKGKRALEKGECGFAYIVGLDSTMNSSSILAVTPLIPGTLRFDPKPFQGVAVILRMDGSATWMRIQPNGEVISDGKNILDPSHPVWGNPFTIAYPE